MNRRELREQIFKLLFRVEFNALEEMPEQMILFLQGDEPENTNWSEEDKQEIQEKYSRIMENLVRLDEMLEKKSEGWTISRMGKVDLAILRLALYEIIMDESVPKGVAINEAVELAKKFGQDGSSAFVNGILAKFGD